MDSVYVGRQPIFNRKGDLFAYELLFRGGDHEQAAILNGDHATSQVIVNSFLELGLKTVLEDKPAFINLTRGFLLGELPMPLSPKEVVIEVLEDIAPDPEVIAALKSYREKGYLIALDDFEFREELKPMLELAHVVKLDLRAHDPDALRKQVEILRPYKKKLLAEKVEEHAEFELCKELGFDLFQGYFFCKPQVIQGKTNSNNRLVMLNLLAKLQSPDTQMDELEVLISQDGPLVHRLLRYINSAGSGVRQEVESIRRALVLLGLQKIKNWVCLIMMSRAEGKSPELMRTSLIRARMSEQLASAAGIQDRDQAFTVGLLSALDAVLDQPMEELLEQLPLSAEVKAALLEGSGPQGNLLRRVMEFEQGEWGTLDADEGASPSGDDIAQAYLDAVDWARQSMSSLND